MIEKALNFIGLSTKKYADNTIKSHEFLLNQQYKEKIGLAECYNTNLQESQFSIKAIKSPILSDYPIFAHNYGIIKSKVLYRDTFIKSKHPRLNHQIEQQILDLGINKQFFENVFDYLYLGSGACLIIINDEMQIEAIPFLYGDKEIVKLTYNNYGSKIIKIEILANDNFTYYSIDINDPYYICYNIKQQNTYLSNLQIASPYIYLQNALLGRDLQNAKGKIQKQNIFTPNFDKIIPNNNNGSIELQAGGNTYEFLDFVEKAYPQIQKQIQEKLDKDENVVLPFNFDVKTVTQSNSQNETAKIREWLDEMIIISGYSNRSISGKSGNSNRSIGEQDRDNLEENTILIFQQKLSNIINRFLLPLILPYSYKDFFFEFYNEETDESLKIKDQKLRSYELLTRTETANLLDRAGLKLEKKQVIDIFASVHGINLLDNETTNKYEVDELISLSQTDSEIKSTNDLDNVFKKYHETVNLSYNELEQWSKNPLSKLASLSRQPIYKNLLLLKTRKENWTQKHINYANKTISFIARMKNMEQGKEIENTGWSKRDISLMNWAYNPKK